MLVSAIISTYNSANFIKFRLDNLLNQTLGNDLEIIVVISGSNQNEKEIVERYLKHHSNMKMVITRNRETIYKAWNRGIRISNGKYITNANTDDVLRKDALELLARELEENPEIALVYADQYISSTPFSNFENKFYKSFNRPEYSRLRFLSKYWVGPQPMWRSSLHFEEDIWFDENLEICGDNDFACRIMEKYQLKKVDNILGVYYKPADHSNKEFQRRELTLKESNLVRDKYSRRFIFSSDSLQKEKLKVIIWFVKFIPDFIYKGINYLLRKVSPRYELVEREYLIYLGSLLAEKENSIDKAISYCKPFLNNKDALLFHWQYLNLTNLKNISK